MLLSDSITIIPILHGKIAFAQHVRGLCLEINFDCIAVDIPQPFQGHMAEAVDRLPYVTTLAADTSAEPSITAYPGAGRGTSTPEPVYYVPIDPCDATIEGIRQCRQNHIPFECIGFPALSTHASLPPIPDEYSLKSIGFDIYTALCLQAIGNPAAGTDEDRAGQYLASRLHELRTRHGKILALVHMRNFARTVYHFGIERTHNISFSIPKEPEINLYYVNTDHLYFVLGELPFVTGKFERERHDPFAEPVDPVVTVKDLFRETRDDYYDEPERIIELSPARIRTALTFLRNLTVMSGHLIPSLPDIVDAAKGVGGNAYALRILKSAKYYPYLPYENDAGTMNAGIDKISLPDGRVRPAVNLFRDMSVVWRTLSIKPDPSLEMKKKYRFAWDPSGMCSHVPEDRRIESFNAHLRTKALRILTEDFVHTEKFSTSIKDGIDIRETLRNWFTGSLYVKELPPSHGKIDTVVIIFDGDHDEKYPHYATWYAEHKEESTLTFYATGPFESMIGPGVARCCYGGLSLLFPPRPVPNIFDLTNESDFPDLKSRLVYGALLFSAERTVAYVAATKPGVRIRTIASRLKKHIVWIPLSHFSNETLRRLRRFHILNGKIVRSWAGRFIGD